MTQHITQFSSARTDQYVTIIAPSLGAVMAQFRERGLGAQGYAITGPSARHQFSYAGENAAKEPSQENLFGGVAMVAATFRRSATA